MIAGTHPSANFVGRRSELKALEQRYASPRSEMVPVYGRRRAGKTELLLRFASGKPTVLFIASDKLRTPQITDFLRDAAEWLAAPHLAEAAPATWEAALRQAASVLEAVALGRRAQSDIARAVGLTASALAPHLKSLVSLGYLERLFPLSSKRPARTSVVYRVADPLLRFWFRFVEPHWATLRRYSPERAFEQIVAPQWEAFCGEGFERLCREALPLLYANEGVSGRFDVGEYWDRTVQIDIVGLRADGWVDLGECRWQGRGSVTQAARELAVRATHFPASGRTVRQILFVLKKSKPATQGTLVYDLAALYGHA